MVTWVYEAQGAPVGPASRHPLTDQERRGKQIYLHGTSASGRTIMARFGDAATQVPASALVCVNCHGYAGQGKPEGGLSPSNITQEALTKPYGVTHPSGRTHPAYNDLFLRRAITMGIDPAGNTLSTAMPRFQFTHDEADDLVAYVKRLGTYHDPGLTEQSVRVGVLVPGQSAKHDRAQIVKAVLSGYFEDLNMQGGIFNRRVEIRFAQPGQTPAQTTERVKDLIDNQEVFAIVSAFIEGAETEIAALIRAEEVPLVGAVTDFPEVGFPLNRYIFYLLSGQREMARAMVDFAVQSHPSQRPRVAILYSQGQTKRSVVQAIEDQCQASYGQPVAKLGYAPDRFEAKDMVAKLKAQHIETLFFLGTRQEHALLLEEVHRQDWQPDLFVPGSEVGKELFDRAAGLAGRVFLAFPRGPADQTPPAVKGFGAFSRKHKLPMRHLTTQLQAYCSAMVLVEALKRAGRDLSREKLTMALEGLYEFETGLIPAITFGPNRRIGSLGAYIVSVDCQSKRLIPASGWVEPQ